MRAATAVPLAFSISLLGCGPPRVVPLVGAIGIPVTRTPLPAIPLEVATRATAVPDPLPVAGARVAYAEVETALGHAVASAAVPWATGRPIDAEPLRLLVELTDARAEQRGDRLAVAFAARGTLRRRRDLGYLAQAVVHCRQAALVPPDRGAEVIDACLVQLGRDLAGWLGAVVR